MAVYIPPAVFDRRSTDTTNTMPTMPFQSNLLFSAREPTQKARKTRRPPKLLAKLRRRSIPEADIGNSRCCELRLESPTWDEPEQDQTPEEREKAEEQYGRFLGWLHGSEKVHHPKKGAVVKAEAGQAAVGKAEVGKAEVGKAEVGKAEIGYFRVSAPA